MRRTLQAVLTLALLLQYVQVWAEDPQAKPHAMEPITVQAELASEPPESPYHLPESAKAATWSIGQQEIQDLQPRDIFDVLSYAPGVQLGYQGRKDMNFIASRGGGNFIGGTNFAILLDGAYIPWTQSGRILASFPLETIESIRVVRDTSILTMAPLSSPGGIGTAIQGVIVIKTRKPTKEETEIKGSVGNLGRYKAYVNHSDNLGNGYYSLSYNKQHDQGRPDWNNGSDSDSFMGKGGYAQHGLKADGTFYYSAGSRETLRSLPISTTSDSKWEYDPLNTLMANGSLSKQWSPAQTTSMMVYTGRMDSTLQYRSWSKRTYSYSDQEDNIVQANLNHMVNTERNNFRVGASAILWDCPNGQLFYEGYQRQEELYSAFAHDEYALTKDLSLDLGARLDKKHIDKGINKYSPNDGTPTKLIQDQWAEPNYAVGAGLSYHFTQVWEGSIRASYTQQAVDEFLLSEKNVPLSSEKQMRYEAGLIGKLHPALRATATAYYYDLHDMKQYTGSVKVGDDYYNLYGNADAGRSGLELDVSGYIYTPKLTYGLSYSYQQSDNQIDDKSIPHHIVALRLGYRMAPFRINLTLRHVSAYDSSQFSVDKLYHGIGDYSPVDANISYDFNIGANQWRATLFAQNLGDEKYQSRLGWEDVGLTYGLELSLKF